MCGYIIAQRHPPRYINATIMLERPETIPPPQALTGSRVLDLTHYAAGPFCTKLLADYGAEVIKVERPGQGDPGRRLGPFDNDLPAPESSALFQFLNQNKLGVTLDLKRSAGVKLFEELALWADVIVESFRPGVMKDFGLGYSRLKQINSNVVLTSISNFGQNGPYKNHKATEIVEYATGGPMLFTGAARREPVKHGGRVGMYFAGQVAAIATLTALYRQMGSETSGDHLDISIMETQAGTIDRQSALLLSHVYTGRRYSRYAGENKGFSQVYPGKDGYMDVQSAGRFPRLLDLLNAPDFFEKNGVDVTTALASPRVIRKLDAMVAEWVAGRTQGESWAQSQAQRTLSAPLYDPAGVASDPGFRARGVWAGVEDSRYGHRVFPARHMIMHRTPWQIGRPAPTLGQHNRNVYCGILGLSRRELSMLRQEGVV